MPKLNYTGSKLADVLRRNLTVPVARSPKRLGVLAGDNEGWPNGRRLGDGVHADDRQRLPAFPYQADPGSGFAGFVSSKGS